MEGIALSTFLHLCHQKEDSAYLLFVHQGSAHCSLRAACGSHSVVWKFYWNTAALTCQCIVFGCFCSGTSGLNSWGRNRITPAELKYLFFYSLQKAFADSRSLLYFQILVPPFSCSTSLLKTTSLLKSVESPYPILCSLWPCAILQDTCLSPAVIPVLALVLISTASLTSSSMTSSH